MRFCFYSGYKNLLGGYTTLLITLITELSRKDEDVLLINFKGGLIDEELLKANIRVKILDLETTSWQEISKKILPTDIFIATRFVEPFKYLLKANPRLIYYDINDFIGQISDYKFGIRLPGLGKKLVKKLLDNNSLIFMDDTGISNLKAHFNLEVSNPIFIPIPVDTSFDNMYLKQFSKLTVALRLTYIGRSVDWKMMPLKKILTDLWGLKDRVPIQFTIVVDNINELFKFININDFSSCPNLVIRIMENIPPSDIPSFLSSSSDLHFAMGTAALDAAKIGVPTILVDYSNLDFPDAYEYKWLYQTKGFSLGRNLLKVQANSGVSLAKIIGEFMGEQNQIQQSTLSYDYVRNNHGADKVVEKLIEVAKISTFRLAQSKNLVPFYFKSHSILKKISTLLSLRS